MADRDVDVLRQRIDSLARAAAKIRAHIGDLHGLGWEKAVGEVEKVNGGAPDRTPRAGDPRARRLYDRIFSEVASIEAELVGLERQMTAVFFAGSSNPEPSRGSLISRAEFDRLKDRQRKRPDTHTRLVDQPQHPGKRP